MAKETLKRNDILVRQFGYNMTLYSFYKVIEIKGNNVKLYPLQAQRSEWIGYMQNEIKPVDTKCYLMSRAINKRFNKYGNISIDNNNLYLYNANEKYIENHAD